MTVQRVSFFVQNMTDTLGRYKVTVQSPPEIRHDGESFCTLKGHKRQIFCSFEASSHAIQRK